MSEPIEATRHLLRRTTHTWEVELLISGVAVFAMLQLPGWLDDRMSALAPRLAEEWLAVLRLSYFYAKSAAVVLATTFALHLLLRAQWIALVGTHSVYPKGILLDRLRMGPIQRAIEEARPESTSDAIERADNRASIVFAIGVSVASILGTICIGFCGILVVATAATRMMGWGMDPLITMCVVFGIFMAPFGFATWLDHQFGARLPDEHWLRRLIQALLRFYTRIGMGRRNNHIVAILTSNGGERKMMGVLVGVMLAAIIGVVVADLLGRDGNRFGSYAQFPESGRLALRPANYDDQRDPTSESLEPFVQSAVITAPYLQLMVPYRPNRDEAAMRAACAMHSSGRRGDALALARLACLQDLHPVTLDGKPVQDLRYDIASDPRSDRPALLAMIDVRDLPRGRHELRIGRPARVGRKQDKDNPDPGYDAIPFWR